MPYIKTRPNLNLYYEIKGRGEPILFIHGWAGDITIWQEQIDFFAKKFLTVALDLPGHGKSSWEKSDLNQLSSDIYSFLNQINLEKINLVAVSFGGLIALKFSLMYPEKIGRLILVDSAAKFLSSEGKEGLRLSQIEKMSVMLDENYLGALLVFTRLLFTEEERRLINFKKIWNILTKKEPMPQKQALQAFLKILQEEDLRPILAKIDAPVLIINGEKDVICPQAKAKELADNLPNARLRIIENSGHMPFLTKPGIFKSILTDFIVYDRVDR